MAVLSQTYKILLNHLQDVIFVILYIKWVSYALTRVYHIELESVNKYED